MKDFEIFDVKFSVNLEFSELTKAGTDAFIAVFPADAEVQNAEISITIVNVSQDFLQQSGMPDEAVSMYVKTTFFGVSQPAETSSTIDIAGQKANLETISKNIPVSSELKLISINTPQNSKMFIGIDAVQSADNQIVTQIINDISSTLTFV